MTPFFPFPNNRELSGIPISVLVVIILSAMDTDELEKVKNLFFSVFRSPNQDEPHPGLRGIYRALSRDADL